MFSKGRRKGVFASREKRGVLREEGEKKGVFARGGREGVS